MLGGATLTSAGEKLEQGLEEKHGEICSNGPLWFQAVPIFGTEMAGWIGICQHWFKYNSSCLGVA